MLYDPKWEQADRVSGLVSLRALIAWLETMPADEEYNYLFPQQCAVAQYLQANGYSKKKSIVSFGTPERSPKPGDSDYWLFQIAIQEPWTFGAALDRARAALVGDR